MALTIYGLREFPDDFLVTKLDVSLEECTYLLDFTRPVERYRQLFGKTHKWIGVTTCLLVPVIHISEPSGQAAGFKIGIYRGAQYFADLPKLWKKHANRPRQLGLADNGDWGKLKVVADFGHHFPEDNA
jgi:hypothetical protein